MTTKQPDITKLADYTGHDHCVVCGSKNPRGLNLTFHQNDDGWILANIDGDKYLQGYDRMMHGGVISLLLDATMTHCLFAHGCAGVTAKMEVKFRHPVMVDSPMTVRAKLVRSSPSAYHLRSELIQNERAKATATGLFVDRPQLNEQDNDVCLEMPRK